MCVYVVCVCCVCMCVCVFLSVAQKHRMHETRRVYMPRVIIEQFDGHFSLSVYLSPSLNIQTFSPSLSLSVPFSSFLPFLLVLVELMMVFVWY